MTGAAFPRVVARPRVGTAEQASCRSGGVLAAFAHPTPLRPVGWAKAKRAHVLWRGPPELGWTDRRNMRMDYRLAESDTLQSVAAAQVALAPDILLVNGSLGLT